MPARRTKTQKPASPALKHLYERFVEGDADQENTYQEHLANAEIARKLHDLRRKVGLSQRELAERVGTSASVICRLERADYQGHSLSMLQRIAAALDKRVEIRFVAVKPRPQPA
ncbi:MAG: helix-turn-helix transcriptional regulator [Phycisphaerae bacterium]